MADMNGLESWLQEHVSSSASVKTTNADSGKYESLAKFLKASIFSEISPGQSANTTVLERLQQQWQDEIKETKNSVVSLRMAKQDKNLKETIFKNKANESEYIALLKKKYSENHMALNSVTFICISGISNVGKDTFVDCVKNTNLMFDIETHSVAFARSLKETCASIFQMDIDNLQNSSDVAKDWMENETSDDALFWSTCLMKSIYVKDELPVYHREDEDTTIYTMSDEDLERNLQDANFRRKHPGIDGEFNTLAKDKDASTLIPEFIKAKIKYINECRDSLIESHNLTSNSSQFIDALRAQDVEIDNQKFPFTPSKMLKDIGTNLFRKKYCEDIFVLSEIRRIIKIKQAQKVPKPIVVILPDVKFLNEILLPCSFGAKVIFAYIEKEDVLAKNVVLKKLDAYLEDAISANDSKVFKRSVPNALHCYEKVVSITSEINKENLANQKPQQDIPSELDWMPIYLKYFMRENYSAQFRDYNMKNMKDISYFRILNKPTDFSNRACVEERISGLLKNYMTILQQSGVFNWWSYKI